MNTETFSLRREWFGGVLFAVESMKRVYVNLAEYAELVATKVLPMKLRQEFQTSPWRLVVVEPLVLPETNFSAPDTVFFEVTRACNLRCTHCFNESGLRLDDELSPMERIQVVKDLAASGVQEVRFTGGEPLVCRDIMELIALAEGLGMRISIGTNAAIINRRMASRLSAAGLHMAVASIDGLETHHDAVRGPGTFKKTLQGINNLRAAGIQVRVNTVVMKSNMSDLPDLVDYLLSYGLPVMVRRLIPSGRAREDHEQMLSREDYDALRLRLKVHLDDPRNLLQGHYLKEHAPKPRIDLPFLRKSCSAGHRGMVILPNGLVQTCGFLGPLGESSVGRVPAESLSVIWNRLVGSGHIGDLEKLLPAHNESTSGPCTNCLAIALAARGNNLVHIGARA